MTSDQIKAALSATPFRPFRVHMGGGRALEVPHPEFMWITPGGRIAGIYAVNGAIEIIDVFMVQSIEFFVSANGKPKRRKSA